MYSSPFAVLSVVVACFSVLPFKSDNNRVILSAKVGDSPALKIILDSGMSYDGLLIYNPDVRNSIELVNPQSASIAGAGNGVASTSVFSESMDFSIGEKIFRNQKIIILQTDQFKGFPTDGVTGYSLLGHHVVEINYDNQTLTLHDPDSMKPDASWEAIPLTFKENSIPWITVSISINDETPKPYSCYIDSASREALELLTRPDQAFDLPKETTDVYLGRGLSGDIHGKKGSIARVTLGSFELKNVVGAFVPAEVRSKQPGADGVIAGGLLGRFNLIFDYMHKTLYLKPNTHFNDPF